MDRFTDLAGNAVDALPALLAVIPIYLVGVAMAWCFGVRGRILPFITSVPLLIGAAALAGEAFALIGLDASPVRLLLVLVLVSALVLGGRWLTAGRGSSANEGAAAAGSRADTVETADKGADATDPAEGRWVAYGGLGGALLGVGTWMPGIGDWSRPPQANDDIFHGYLVARLADATDLGAAALAPAFVDSAAPAVYYPYGMHLLMTLADALTPAGVATVMNGTWILLLGALLPLGTAAAARELFPGRPRAALWAGLLAPLPTSLYLLNGVMSYAMTVALIPAVLALVLRRMTSARDVPAAVLAIVLASLFISHPAAALTAAIVIACVAIGRLVGRTRDTIIDWAAVYRLVPCALGALVLIVPWYRAAGSAGVGGSTVVAALMSTSSAIAAGVKLSTPWAPAQLLLAGLVVLGGVAVVVWRDGRGLLVAYVAFLVTYVSILAGFSPIASHSGLWYGQWYRLAGVVGVLAPLLGAAGAELLVGFLRAASDDRVKVDRPRLAKVAAVAVLVALLAGGAVGARYLLRNNSVVTTAWGYTTVTDEDEDFFHAVGAEVGEDEEVLNYWADGSTWMYALAGVTPAIPYDTTVHAESWPGEMLNGVAALADRPDLCQMMLDKKIRFALAKKTLNDNTPSNWYADLAATTDLFHEVSSSSTTTLYSVDRPELERCATSG